MAKRSTLIPSQAARYVKAATLELLSSEFKQQCEFIQDKAKLKALFCTRRAAKSYTAGLYLVQECLENPGVNCLFIGLTRLSAKGIVWKDILKIIDRKHGLHIKFNETLLTASFPNGSIIHIAGIDNHEDEGMKLLGKKYKLAILDEASMYSVNLRHLVYGILKPAMADVRGTICMIGTSSDITKGLFYDITTGNEPGWSVHTWSALDNPFVAKQWQEELDEIATQRPLYMETAQFQQWYLNKWVVDTDKLVYKYNPTKNRYTQLPNISKGRWSYVLGVDLGYSPDPSAFVLCAYHEYDRKLYMMEAFKQTEMDITDVATKIRQYQSRYTIYQVVIDGANKQAVEEIRKRHNITLQAADKTGKSDFVEIMNAELIQANVLLHESLINLQEEYQSLVWVTDGDKVKHPRKENPNLPNHLADAALYAWRYCYSYLATKEPMPTTDARTQWVKYSQEMAESALQRQIDRQEADDAQALQLDMMDADPYNENPLSVYMNKRNK